MKGGGGGGVGGDWGWGEEKGGGKRGGGGKKKKKGGELNWEGKRKGGKKKGNGEKKGGLIGVSTLIVALGEFGRTPGPLNSQNGRDHYPAVMSVLLAGGGVRGGQAIGVTDATIVDPGWSGQRPIYLEDIASTIYSALGIDWTKSIENNPMGRTYVYVPGSDVGAFGAIEEVFR